MNRPPRARTVQVRLLATTDLHMNLCGWDYYADRDEPAIGLTRTARLIAQARSEAEEAGALSLLFDNGDSLQGTPMGDLATRLDPGEPHPLMAAFRRLQYDAIGLGNHDFNFGLPSLARALSHAPCPVICSNVDWVSADDMGCVPHAILRRETRHGALSIGVLSVLPPQTVVWDKDLLAKHVQVREMVDAARELVPRLRAAGCDLVVALAHSGIGAANEHPMQENAIRPLAALPGIDAIIAGHTHQRFPGPVFEGLKDVDPVNGTIHGTPVVMAATAGTCLGMIDLRLEQDADGQGWTVIGSTTQLRCIGNGDITTAEDPELRRVLEPAHQATRGEMNRHVGHLDRPMHSYFSLFAPDDGLALVAAAQAHAVRNALADTDYADLPVLSAVAPGKFGARNGPHYYSDVPAGPISLRHIADLHVFPNELRAVVVTGAVLREWLEMPASLFHKITPGADGADLVDPLVPGYNFDVIHGITYELDLTQPARFAPNGAVRNENARRVAQVRLDGVEIEDNDRFVVAINSYRANGGGNVQALKSAEQIALPPRRITDILRDYVVAKGSDPIEHAPAPWRFAPARDASVAVLTGPGARAHLHSLGDLRVSEAGLDGSGFLRLILTL
ncbi:MAG: bifunctional 2',3'-cyclic-nucleotide 2'-phosphodiesterase/3'-nucleotidase [Pseudomonadota bacterium]